MIDYGPVETSVRRFVQGLLPLKGTEPSLARVAFRLARSLDDAESDERTLPATSKELRSILAELKEGRGDDDALNLETPV